MAEVVRAGSVTCQIEHVSGFNTCRLRGGSSWADRAKAEALQALRSLRTEGPEGPGIATARITRWCQTVVKPLVRQVA
jgi:hypothetical protein